MTTRKESADELALQRIGKAVRSQRGERTQMQIQELSGIPQSVLSRIETGDYRSVTPALVIRLCLALECRPSQILDLDDIVTIARFEAEAA